MADNRTTLSTFAAESMDEADVELLVRLATAYESRDPVPEGLVERLQFGVTLDALLARYLD